MSYRGIAWRRSFHERVNFEAAAVMAVAAAASAAISAAGAVQQGETARKSADHQAALAENNALAARQQAELDERQQREKARRLMATQRAQAAGRGVLTEQGSPLFVSLDTGEQAEIAALNIRRAGELRSNELHSQASLTRFQGAASEDAGYLKAGTSLLDGVSKVAPYAKQKGWLT